MRRLRAALLGGLAAFAIFMAVYGLFVLHHGPIPLERP